LKGFISCSSGSWKEVPLIILCLFYSFVFILFINITGVTKI
jgi:hypothetical protein